MRMNGESNAGEHFLAEGMDDGIGAEEVIGDDIIDIPPPSSTPTTPTIPVPPPLLQASSGSNSTNTTATPFSSGTTVTFVTSSGSHRVIRNPMVVRSSGGMVLSQSPAGTGRLIVKGPMPGGLTKAQTIAQQIIHNVNNGGPQQMRKLIMAQKGGVGMPKGQTFKKVVVTSAGAFTLTGGRGGVGQQLVAMRKSAPAVTGQYSLPPQLPLRPTASASLLRQDPIEMAPMVSTPPKTVKSTSPEVGGGQVGNGKGSKKKSIQMRLRCRTSPLPLQGTYFENDDVIEKDADVLFQCGDGGRVRAHKVILATVSTYFTDIFKDEPVGEVSVVSVPDFASDIMKLLILLCYKESVTITGEQLAKVKDYFDFFRIDFRHLVAEASKEEYPLDVFPGKVTENIRAAFQKQQQQQQQQIQVQTQSQVQMEGARKRMVPSFTPQQLQQLQMKKQTHVTPVGMNRARQVPEYDNEEPPSKFPRVETETDESNETDDGHLGEPDEQMIKEWMANVGRNKPSFNNNQFECRVCTQKFVKELPWKWHQDRHVNQGSYRCPFCHVIKSSATILWNHERNLHNFAGIGIVDVKEDPRGGGGALSAASAARLAQMKRIKSRAAGIGLSSATLAASAVSNRQHGDMKTYKPFTPSSPLIKAGPEPTDVDSRKIKQLHWLYVCAKCDNVSDSQGKAQLHYKKCYPELNTTFENTVMKYRQGFYGKSKCPMCSRKYVSNGGWMIHAAHAHPDFRKLFAHTGNVDDKIRCVNCAKKFINPEEFNFHLINGERCPHPYGVYADDSQGPSQTGNGRQSALSDFELARTLQIGKRSRRIIKVQPPRILLSLEPLQSLILHPL